MTTIKRRLEKLEKDERDPFSEDEILKRTPVMKGSPEHAKAIEKGWNVPVLWTDEPIPDHPVL